MHDPACELRRTRIRRSSQNPIYANFVELRHGEVRRTHHRRTSGSVKLHSWVTTLGQQDTEVQDGSSSTLWCTSPVNPACRARGVQDARRGAQRGDRRGGGERGGEPPRVLPPPLPRETETVPFLP